jgi:hypothetical protein
MCIELAFDKTVVQIESNFDSLGRIMVQRNRFTIEGTQLFGEVYLAGLVKKEDKSEWISNSWCSVEILATGFKQNGKWYNVPSGQVIRGIIFNTSEKYILKIITRESIKQETDIQDQPIETGRRILVLRI